MAEEKAVIRAELEGTAKVVSDSKKVGSALNNAKKEGEGLKTGAKGAASEVQGLGKEVDGLIKNLTPRALLGASLGGMVVAGVGATISYLKEGAAQAAQFNAATASGARRAGVDLTAYRGVLEQTERETHVSKEAQQGLVDAVQRTSYGGAQAALAMRSVGASIALSGRDAQDFAGALGTLTGALGQSAQQLGPDLAGLEETAKRLKVTGGPQALLDTIEALGPAFREVNTTAPGAVDKLLAFTAVASKGRSPAQAREIVAGSISAIKANAYNMRRMGWGDQLDQNGDVRDPMASLKVLRDSALKKNNNNPQDAMEGLAKLVGERTARFVFSPDFDTIGQVAGAMPEDRKQGAQKAEQHLAELNKTDEEKRREREIKAAQRQKQVGQASLYWSDIYDQAKEGVTGVLAESFTPPGTVPLSNPDESPSSQKGFGARLVGDDELKTLLQQIANNTKPVAATEQKPTIIRLPLNVQEKPQ